MNRDKQVSPGSGIGLDRTLTMELVRVTERSGVAAAMLRGRGDEAAADRAAASAMRAELDFLPIDGTVVFGEGEEGEAPILYNGERVGTGHGPEVDLAVDPLEGKTICAKNLPNSMTVVALAERGSLLKVPAVYMEKIAIGPGYPDGIVDLDMDPAEVIAALARAKGVEPMEISACILDRPRNARVIAQVRSTGAAVRLIGDGDIAGVIHTTNPQETGVDVYLGSGGAAEGVLAAAALSCMGGQMQGRLDLRNPQHRERARRSGFEQPQQKFDIGGMVSGDVVFAATGITDGNFLSGVRLSRTTIETETVVMRSSTRTVRWIRSRHTRLDRFRLD